MITYLVRKIWKNKWMMFCLLIGNILLIGISASTPLYSNASMGHILRRDMDAFQLRYDEFPAILALSYTFNYVNRDTRVHFYYHTQNEYVPQLLDDLGLPALMTVQSNIMSGRRLIPYVPREQRVRSRVLDLIGGEGFAEHIHITQGRLPADYLVDGNIIEAIAVSAALSRHDILLGELLVLQDIGASSDPLFVRVVGLYEPLEASGMYWSVVPAAWEHSLLVSDILMRERFIAYYSTDYNITAHWVHMLDFIAMASRHIPHYLHTLDAWRYRLGEFGQIWALSDNFTDTIQEHSAGMGPLAITLWVLQVPVYVLMALYIYMVSNRILQMEQNDISVLKSRGVSRWQLLGIYALQGLGIAVISYPIGIVLGVALCRVLGASSGFLDLVQRTALVVDITPETLLYAGLAVLFSFLTMLIPVIKLSRVDIVAHKRRMTGRKQKALWYKFYLDIVFLGVSLYGFYSFNSQRDVMALMIREGQSVDPLLFVSSSLFIMGFGLLCLRIFPYLIKLIFIIGCRMWSPSAYASMIKVMRSAGEEQFIMIFLLFTLSLGIFSAQAARTLNMNNEHQIRYLAGADIIFQESWRSESPPLPGEWEGVPGTEPTRTVFFEPSFERFTGFAEVDAITRVQRQTVTLRPVGEVRNNLPVQLMGIDTVSFGETVWFRDDLLMVDINHFLNTLAGQANGVLISDFFRTNAGVRVGDSISFINDFGNTAHSIVVGFVEHWPGFAPVKRVVDDTGDMREEAQHLIVANLAFLQTGWGVQPYEVWMRTSTDSNLFFYEFVRESQLNLRAFFDTDNAVILSLSNPILQGTNGVLTINFIVSLIICFVGFLIYWILSIRSRVLQFGVFRAMGMGMRSIIGLLASEQFLVTFMAIAIGAMVGELAARLYVPLIQISYTAADQVIPLMIVAQASDYVNLYTFISIMIVLCLIILALFVSRIRITQALKLGED